MEPLEADELQRPARAHKLCLPLLPIAINEAEAFRWVGRHLALDVGEGRLALAGELELVDRCELAAPGAA
jgi:hypothetical protein